MTSVSNLRPSIGTAPIALLPETTSVIVPVMRVPEGTATRPSTVTADVRRASKGSPALAVLLERSDDRATFSCVPAGTSMGFGTGFGAGAGVAAAVVELFVEVV